ncbi:hypothetical protein PspLS_02792 [Pyricularia sp. CBS 133598]|nr:hypothetical protein PspLS_02792 [Pyricularia sp. CBS 133598]
MPKKPKKIGRLIAALRALGRPSRGPGVAVVVLSPSQVKALREEVPDPLPEGEIVFVAPTWVDFDH